MKVGIKIMKIRLLYFQCPNFVCVDVDEKILHRCKRVTSLLMHFRYHQPCTKPPIYALPLSVMLYDCSVHLLPAGPRPGVGVVAAVIGCRPFSSPPVTVVSRGWSRRIVSSRLMRSWIVSSRLRRSRMVSSRLRRSRIVSNRLGTLRVSWPWSLWLRRPHWHGGGCGGGLTDQLLLLLPRNPCHPVPERLAWERFVQGFTQYIYSMKDDAYYGGYEQEDADDDEDSTEGLLVDGHLEHVGRRGGDQEDDTGKHCHDEEGRPWPPLVVVPVVLLPLLDRLTLALRRLPHAELERAPRIYTAKEISPFSRWKRCQPLTSNCCINVLHQCESSGCHMRICSALQWPGTRESNHLLKWGKCCPTSCWHCSWTNWEACDLGR